MKKDLALWQFAAFVITVALGSVLHFLFDWTGTRLLAPISAVNESTWEHMKILFFPMLIFACVQYFIFRDAYAGFWWIKLIGIVVGVILIPILFYTSNGAFGKTRDWLNITAKICFEKHRIYKGKGPVLKAEKAVVCNPPEEQLATFY